MTTVTHDIIITVARGSFSKLWHQNILYFRSRLTTLSQIHSIEGLTFISDEKNLIRGVKIFFVLRFKPFLFCYSSWFVSILKPTAYYRTEFMHFTTSYVSNLLIHSQLSTFLLLCMLFTGKWCQLDSFASDFYVIGAKILHTNFTWDPLVNDHQ